MEMTQERWAGMLPSERAKYRSDASLTPQLIGLEGWRVEVVSTYGETRRFIVGKSMGWEPIHLEVSRRTSHGGLGAAREYKSVRKLYKVR